MRPSLYMKCTVDKQQKLEAGSWKLENRSLFGGLTRANYYLATFVAERIGKDVGSVIFVAQLFVERPCSCRTDKHK